MYIYIYISLRYTPSIYFSYLAFGVKSIICIIFFQKKTLYVFDLNKKKTDFFSSLIYIVHCFNILYFLYYMINN